MIPNSNKCNTHDVSKLFIILIIISIINEKNIIDDSTNDDIFNNVEINQV